MRRSELETTALLALLIFSSCVAGEPKIRCKEAERQALLKFKEGLYEFRFDVLSSWGKEEAKSECCEWIGVRCDGESGHVISLDLSPLTFGWIDFGGTPLLSGNLSSPLLDLQYLSYLDFSFVSFYETSSIPEFLGNLSQLKYLNLSYTGMTGEVPPHLGNLSALQVLDLSDNFKRIKTISNLGWVSRLSGLKVLDLSYVDISAAKDWVNVVTKLPNLSKLRLRFSGLSDTVPSSVSFVNSSKNLAFLDLSGNKLSPSIFYRWISGYSKSLVHLDLNSCWINGTIPGDFGNMSFLEYLDLGANMFEGRIPESLGNLKAVSFLGLGNNQLSGTIPESFGNLSALEYLDLQTNLLTGEIPKSIWEICTLRYFNAYHNSLTGPLRFAKSSPSCAHFALENLYLQENKIGGSLPDLTLYPNLINLLLKLNQLDGIDSESLGQLSKLDTLDLSENVIQTVITEAHFSKLFKLRYLDLSSNMHIVLNISSNWVPPFQPDYILLRSCKLGPRFPNWLRNQKRDMELDISDSGISDSIPNWFWNPPRTAGNVNLSNNEITAVSQDNGRSFNFLWTGLISTTVVDLSSNRLKGSVPWFLLNTYILRLSRNKFSDLKSLCTNTTSLSFLDISDNQLSGELPDCWTNAPNLGVLILRNNKLWGKIPISIGLLTQISALHLSYNKFTGELPSSLQNCTQLMVLDLGANNLSGPVPAWIGKNFPNLAILSLRSNKFYRSVPSQLCHLSNLQVLDLSSNSLTSSIPRCVGYFEAMKVTGSQSILFSPEPIFLIWKGAVSDFKALMLLRNIDLSSNKFIGEIPKEITQLVGLVSLNLSRNILNGQIPRNIGQLKDLDALDLSNNDLSGSIPQSLAKIDRLSTLDLSNNNLSGKIPTGPQLQNRDASAYSGNPELCGEPLPTRCEGEEEPISTQAKEDRTLHQDDGEFVTVGFYISIVLGFIIGFCGVNFGGLIFNMFRKRTLFKS